MFSADEILMGEAKPFLRMTAKYVANEHRVALVNGECRVIRQQRRQHRRRQQRARCHLKLLLLLELI